MLTAILPGLRDFRTPLVTGALLSFSIYLCFYAWLPNVRPDDLPPALGAITETFGSGVAVGTASVLVYLVGSVWVSARDFLVHKASARSLAVCVTPEYLTGSITRYRRLVAPFSRPSLRRMGRLKGPEYDPDCAYAVGFEVIFSGGKRLIVANSALYDNWDKTRSEAQFRDSIVLPGMFILIYLCWVVDLPFWLRVVGTVGAIALGVAIFVHARHLEMTAQSMYAHAVCDGVIKTTALDSSSGYQSGGVVSKMPAAGDESTE